jgi:hypothetical protein
VAFFLCGCSQTTVHLYSKYLSDQQIKVINNELVTADFVVRLNQLQFPQSVTQSSLTYSPLIKDRHAVNELINAMSHIGWDIQHTSMLFIDNHWYKENSIALMLVPPGIDPQTITNHQNLANIYKSRNCEKQLTINLEQNGQYQISAGQEKPLNHLIAAGKWTINQFPYLELLPTGADWSLYFELEHRLEVDQIGQIEIAELSPMDNHSILIGCTFIHGLRI